MMKYYNIPLINRLLLAAVSGALVFPISYLENLNRTIYADISLIDILIGIIFAVLVMVPFQKRKNWLKSVLMIIASIAIYTSMVNLAVNNYKVFSLNLNIEWAITVSGGLGALLTGIAVKLIAQIRLANSAYPLLIILGLVAGYIFSITIDAQSSMVNAVGFIVWQVLTCLAIAVSKK